MKSEKNLSSLQPDQSNLAVDLYSEAQPEILPPLERCVQNIVKDASALPQDYVDSVVVPEGGE